ncbi:MAG: TfoX/Sxy family protein [Anaerolineales bacterium]
MKNIGPRSSQWLVSIGIRTLDDVAKIGVVETYKRVKAAYPDKVTLNMLWGLQAALLDIPWNELPPAIKEQLKQQLGE